MTADAGACSYAKHKDDTRDSDGLPVVPERSSDELRALVRLALDAGADPEAARLAAMGVDE